MHYPARLQGKFEERWQSVVVPKIADEMNTCKTEEVAAERRLQETRRARELELYDRRSAQLLAEIDVGPISRPSLSFAASVLPPFLPPASPPSLEPFTACHLPPPPTSPLFAASL